MKLDAKKWKENGIEFSLVLRRCEAWKKNSREKEKKRMLFKLIIFKNMAQVEPDLSERKEWKKFILGPRTVQNCK